MTEKEYIISENQKLYRRIQILESQNSTLKLELKRKDDLSEIYDNVLNCLNVDKGSIVQMDLNDPDSKKLK